MKGKFTKADLKYGYIVEMRGGDKALYMPSIDGDSFDFQNDAECLLLNKYNEDLTSMISGEYDIVKVYGFARPYETFTFDLKKRSTLWQRIETKRMTTEEMRQKLEELTGEKIEVAKELSRNEMIGVLYQYCDTKPLCHGCCLNYGSSCSFHTYTDEVLKKCYKKVMEDETI